MINMIYWLRHCCMILVKPSHPISVFERSLIVLAQWFFPRSMLVCGGMARLWGGNGRLLSKCSIPNGAHKWRQAVGCSELTISLIRRHQDTLVEIESQEDRLLQQLQWADDQN